MLPTRCTTCVTDFPATCEVATIGLLGKHTTKRVHHMPDVPISPCALADNVEILQNDILHELLTLVIKTLDCP